MDRENCWQAVMNRDKQFDGFFVYAVRSTGIYCRPSCSSKRPRREQVVFFPMPEAAEQAGFRPCLRCRPQKADIQDPMAKMVQQVCQIIEKHDFSKPLTLSALGAQLFINPQHLQKTFKRYMGITPRQYIESCRLHRLKVLFKGGKDVTNALFEAGYSSSSRLYEQAPARLGMTPGTYLRGGKGMDIDYTIVDSPLGRLLIGSTGKGLCAVSLGESDAALIKTLYKEYPAAEIRRNDKGLGRCKEILTKYWNGLQPHEDLPLDLRATAFQWRVYEELRAIPYGSTRSYEEIARAIGKPKAFRAVARACAGNPVALLIPCHRVVRKDGALAGYRWGIKRKESLLELEKRVVVPAVAKQPGKTLKAAHKSMQCNNFARGCSYFCKFFLG
ncbi:MAG: bifunctional DNA-binding transcriptional regulator/O6-methylguanine-DNA methyltransferase Ada [Desulfocucumaceae bacterium]